MASGSSSSSGFFLATTRADHREVMMNSQQESSLVQPTSSIPTQQHNRNLVAPMNQWNQPPPTYPEAQIVVTVSTTTLLDAKRHVCEVCYQGFPRLQNLSYHQKTHNRPATFKRKTANDVVPRKVYLCPEPTCAHHNRSHALGDFAGLKKHYLRKHSTHKNYKCNKCTKAYAVLSDLKTHMRICGKRKYKCDCGAQVSSHDTFNAHLENCDARKHEGAAKDPPISNTGNSSVRSASNSSLIGSTTAHLPSFDMGDRSVGSISNDNSSSLMASTTSTLPMFNKGDSSVTNISSNNSSILISSTTSPQLTLGMEHCSSRSTSNSYPSTTPNQPQLYHFATDHDILVTDPSAMSLNLGEIPPTFFLPTSTQQSDHGFQENFDMRLYTNLIMNDIPFDNVTHDDMISHMGYAGNYGRSNSFTSGGIVFDSSSSLNSITIMQNASLGQQLSAPEFFLNNNSIGSTSGNNVTSNMALANRSSYSSSGVEFITLQEHNVLFGNPDLAQNEYLPFSTSRINSSSNMVQGYASSSSSGVRGFIKPQEKNVLFSSDPVDIADNSAYNPFMNPETGSGVGSAIFNQDVGGMYQQGGYFDHGDGSGNFDHVS